MQNARSTAESQYNKILEKGYHFLQQVGKGAFASVWQIQKDNQLFAVKIIDKQLFKSKPFLTTYINTEIRSMKKINSNHCVKLIDQAEDKNWIYIIMEYCEDNLLTFLKTRTKGNGFEQEEALNYLQQILKGLMAIHEMGYIHRDLKPENILIKDGVLKIADFGFAKPLSKTGLTNTYCGTDEFMAPEIHMRGEYNYKVAALRECFSRDLKLKNED